LSAASAASEEIARLRRQLADAEQRSAFTGAAAEAAGKASALTVYGEKLGPSPSDPEHSSRALDEIEAKLAAAAAESDLADDTVIVASRRERAGMRRDLTAAEATAEGMQEEVERVRAEGTALAAALNRELSNQSQLKQTAQDEASLPHTSSTLNPTPRMLHYASTLKTVNFNYKPSTLIPESKF
jgi:hypothetical protein